MPPHHQNAAAAKIEKIARELAIAQGHKDPDAEIVCVGGVKEAAWRFYVDEAYDQLLGEQRIR